MFQIETIPGTKKAGGFFIKIYLKILSIFHIRSHFPRAFLLERIISLKNGGIM